MTDDPTPNCPGSRQRSEVFFLNQWACPQDGCHFESSWRRTPDHTKPPKGLL